MPEYLPPRPGSTGEPFPPHAPAYEGVGAPGEGESSENDSGDRPKSPPGQGPTLAWYQGSRRGMLSVFAIFLFVLVIAISVHAYLTDGDAFRWMRTWWMWLAVIALSVPPALTVKAERCSAGAEWLRGRKVWVRIYELEIIQAKPASTGLWLDLKDSDGREIDIEVLTLQYNRRLWDLVYNGMLHSATNGAVVNRRAQQAFKLPGRIGGDV